MTLVFSGTSVYAQPEIEPVADCPVVFLGYWNGVYYYETVSCIQPSVTGYGTSGALCELGCTGPVCLCPVTPAAARKAASMPRYPDSDWVDAFLERVEALYARRDDPLLNPMRKKAATTMHDAGSDARTALAAFLAAPDSEKLNKWGDYLDVAEMAHTLIDFEPVQLNRRKLLLLADGLYPFRDDPVQSQTNKYQARNMPSLRPNPDAPSSVQTGRPSVIIEVPEFLGEGTPSVYFQIRTVKSGSRGSTLRVGQQVRTPDAEDLQLDKRRDGELISRGRQAHTIKYQGEFWGVTTIPTAEEGDPEKEGAEQEGAKK